MIRRHKIGYVYWYMQRHAFGWRQIGPECHMVMDDYGTLVMTGEPL